MTGYAYKAGVFIGHVHLEEDQVGKNGRRSCWPIFTNCTIVGYIIRCPTIDFARNPGSIQEIHPSTGISYSTQLPHPGSTNNCSIEPVSACDREYPEGCTSSTSPTWVEGGSTYVALGENNMINTYLNLFKILESRFGVYLSDVERSLILEYPDLVYPLMSVIQSTGQKPTIDNLIESAAGDDPSKATLKIVGQDPYDENTHYRLYKRECEAYEYLFNKALTSNSEYGAYITDKGIIVYPNSQAFVGSDGVPKINHRIWRIRQTNTKIVYTDKGIFKILGLVHTHPNGVVSPSTFDIGVLNEHPDLKHYVMGPLQMSRYFADGSTEPALSALYSRCP